MKSTIINFAFKSKQGEGENVFFLNISEFEVVCNISYFYVFLKIIKCNSDKFM